MIFIRHYQFITVFFIPVIPINLEKELKCTICRFEASASKEEVEQLIAQSGDYRIGNGDAYNNGYNNGYGNTYGNGNKQAF
ncbi:hypothetical protein CANARDRAFT_27063 [[Candida] arabinofermentans NRRL YB-2248]|uniref:Uncharacterized protein n=1 Tax=[Candida] arabinofermentans NRRL YB-2248 TaxID=983967 RepID=A0A1E4T4E7_9ASCO|nr:hypothetical protein CANARDRAFT_27063 [[Candida] arabinofermentans NRRL YB-2248]